MSGQDFGYGAPKNWEGENLIPPGILPIANPRFSEGVIGSGTSSETGTANHPHEPIRFDMVDTRIPFSSILLLSESIPANPVTVRTHQRVIWPGFPPGRESPGPHGPFNPRKPVAPSGADIPYGIGKDVNVISDRETKGFHPEPAIEPGRMKRPRPFHKGEAF